MPTAQNAHDRNFYIGEVVGGKAHIIYKTSAVIRI